MEVRSQYTDRYKKDMSIDNLRAKVARRKSITQKENRHKEFRKSRGLSLADVNVSLVREQELTVVEEMNESCHVKGHENKPAIRGRTKELIVKDERRAMLQRFKEEKQLRKLKEQRAKANIFKCGIYKPETSFIPVLTTQTAAKVKQKLTVPSITRVTRSTAKTELTASKTRTQAIPVNVLSNKTPVDRAIPKGPGQAIVKKIESKVSAIPSMRTRSAAPAISKHHVQTDVKVPLKNTAATKLQKKTEKESSPEKVVDKTESPAIDQSNDKVQEPEPILKDTSVENETLPESLPVVHNRKPSFAPQNFVFQPLDGLSRFNFRPMTPNRANAFLTPAFTWSPLDGKRKFVVTREFNAEDHKIDLVSPTEFSLTTTEVKPELDLNVSPQDKVLECASDSNSAPQSSSEVTSPPYEPSAEDIKTTQQEQSLHDVPYFRDILKSEIRKLALLCSDWDKRIDMDIPEDAKDLIRTTVGQTRLLMTERFKQFEGLVDNCEFKRGERETTCTDLDGFWDMIYFQIEDVSKKFVDLGKLEENSWQQNTVQTKKVVRKKVASATTEKLNQGDGGRTAARNRLAAIKAAMKNRFKMEEQSAEEAPMVPMQVDPVVFDAGFFRVESPAKLPGSLRIIQSSSELNTPKSTQKIVQNSATPITNVVEGAAVGVKSEKSPSPVESLVRKALFGIPEEESLQNQEPGPIMQNSQHTEPDSVPAVVDLTKYLVAAQPIGLGAEESPGLMKCLGLAASDTTQDGCDTETSGTDDVFMCSPGKIEHTTAASSLPSELGPDEDVKTTRNPLEFLGSCTPIMVKHSPMRVEPGTPTTDLIMFSPMDE